MMNILDEIIAHKRRFIARLDIENIKSDSMASPLFGRECYSLKANLSKSSEPGIIAEFKRSSPSEGTINDQAVLEDVVSKYAERAAGISILTDKTYFSGELADLINARANVKIPLLRKDFIVDPIQLFQAKAAGADCILLIACVLDEREMLELSTIAHDLGLEILLEIHDIEELDKVIVEPDILGINNRNLKTFKTNISQSISQKSSIPSHWVSISESGIHNVEDAILLKKAGFDGFLIGTQFMRTQDPGGSFLTFYQALKDNYGG